MLRRVLIVGGGFAGMSAAIVLRRLGLAVDLVERDPDWRIYGAGITITSPTLRACQRLGILDELKSIGATWRFGHLFEADGRPAGRVEWPPFAADQPSAGGIMRPQMHAVLSAHVRAAGANVRLGCTVAALTQDAAAATVQFSDGSTGHYDFVIGADGIFSQLRGMILPNAPAPKFTGQSVYRLVCERPPGVDSSHFYPRGDSLLGCSLVSATHMYLFLLLPMPGNPRLASEDQPQHLYEKLAPWGGFVADIRERVRQSPLRETINYRPLEALILPRPWHVGRVLLIGDAAHATTPHMASGAGMAIEDALVLGEEIARGGDLPVMLQRFEERRFERCRLVVENSVSIGEMEMRGASALEHNALVGATIQELMREP
jgi:2-polyprenyl-6-methoxyphenol hydroxylase-like FAD-dependent oxidoreductase